MNVIRVLPVLLALSLPQFADAGNCRNGQCSPSSSVNSRVTNSRGSSSGQIRNLRMQNNQARQSVGRSNGRLDSSLAQQIIALRRLGYYRDARTGEWMYQAPNSTRAVKATRLPAVR